MKLRDWYDARTERERRIVAAGGATGAALLLAALLWQLGGAVTAAEQRVARKQQDLRWIEAVTPRLQAMPANRPGESLAIAVDRTARATGLGETLAGIEPAGPGALRVRFEGAAFDALALCLARLEQERGAVAETASISGSGEPGRVDAMLVLRGR